MKRRTFLAALATSSALPLLLRLPRSSERLSTITLSGSGPEGRWFQETSLFGKILTDRIPGLVVNGVIGKGVSVGNIKRIAAGNVEGGRFYLFDLENAHANLHPFEQGDYRDVLVWMKLGTNVFRVVAEKGIEQFSDLEGKTVAIGAKGSGDDLLAMRKMRLRMVKSTPSRSRTLATTWVISDRSSPLVDSARMWTSSHPMTTRVSHSSNRTGVSS